MHINCVVVVVVATPSCDSPTAITNGYVVYCLRGLILYN